MILGKGGKVGPEHLERSESAMEENQRTALAVDFIVQLDAVHIGVLACRLAWSTPVAGALRIAARGSGNHRRREYGSQTWNSSPRNGPHRFISFSLFLWEPAL